MPKGIVFDIQRFSVNDGPGIRTTVFLKGCPLACQWCHNPEGEKCVPQIQYKESKCIGCGKCEKILGHAPKVSAGCQVESRVEEAAKHCPTGAFSIIGKEYSPEKLLEIILRDKDFYGETGGVTFSGGEPLMQSEFVEELLGLCRENHIHTAIDTCGYGDAEKFEKLVSKSDMVLFDIKGISREKHRFYTGVYNECIWDNFRKTMELEISTCVRIPLIKGFTEDEDEFKQIINFLLPYRSDIGQITLIPYHSFGNVKYPTLGLDFKSFDEIQDETLRHYENIMRAQGFVVGC